MFYRSNITPSEPSIIESLDSETSKSLFRDFITKKPTLEDAFYSAGIPKYDLVVEDAMVYANKTRENPMISTLGLTFDEAVAISCYTLQQKFPETKSPYKILSESLR